MTPEPVGLPLALRIYPEPQLKEKPKATSAGRRWPIPDIWLPWDTESRTAETQNLSFGSYRILIRGACLEEGLFYADDLPAADRRVLEEYVRTHRADVSPKGRPELRLLSRREFLKRFFLVAYKGQGLVIGHNLPFDCSRLGISYGDARGKFAGGFSLALWDYVAEDGSSRPSIHRPRINIKHIDSKRSFIGFTGRAAPGDDERIPEGSPSGESVEGYIFRGNFLDTKTGAFVLTDEPHSLESACEAFAVEHSKIKVAKHGIVTPEYIDYNRRDVVATTELAAKLVDEYRRHPISLQITKAYSSASIGRSYLEAMGIPPILKRQPEFNKRYLGFSEIGFYGGLASSNIRNFAVPAVTCDFRAMYSTLTCLFKIWPLLTAQKILVRHGKDEVQEFLAKLTIEQLFDPNTWPKLTAFVKIIPNGDLLPTRCRYSRKSNDWQIALNYLYAGEAASGGLWYALPDVVASVLLTGRIPTIVDAFYIEADGVLDGLRSVRFRGLVEIDPKTESFLQKVIEERERIRVRDDLAEAERKWLDKSLKTIGSATSYGILAQMDRHEANGKVPVTCYGLDPDPYICRVEHPEQPGEYCFPPLASLITSGAHLMLALLELLVTAAGGTYVMKDTDALAVAGTKKGGLVPCPGGPYRTADGREAIMALSWAQVDSIADRFTALNPYDKTAVPGSILRIEPDNYDLKTGEQRQVWIIAIAAKRYAPFLIDENGEPQLLRKGQNNAKDRWSEHGLGHLLNPIDPESEDRDWIAAVWLNIIRKALGLPTSALGFERRPAVGRITVSSPHVMAPFEALNAGRPYADQIKPFNFLLACHVKKLGHPIGADPNRFHLIAPYDPNPKNWLKMKWIDQYNRRKYRISTTMQHGDRHTARVQTYGDVIKEYERHPEAKCADAQGRPCSAQTRGLLQRRHVQVDQLRFIGKESNYLEDVEGGLEHDPAAVYTEYPDPRYDEWHVVILPALKKIPVSALMRLSGLSRAAIQATRRGRRPRKRNQEVLISLIRDIGGRQLLRQN